MVTKQRVFKTKWLARFARKEDINDRKLSDAVRGAERGLNDGELGGGLIKKPVARAGKGKSGGYRTIVVYRAGARAVFVYGFPKSTRANLGAMELDAYQKLAQVYLGFNDAELAKALSSGELEELNYHDEKISE